jgi:uncharacterized protein (UPF0332 family)
MKEEVAGWLSRARHALRVARSLRDSGWPEDTVSKAYYAMFYVAKALTVHRGKTVSKHRAVIAAFGFDFARTGDMDPRFHEYINEAFDQRGIADYTWNAEMRDRVASEHIKRAEEFLAAAEAYLRDHPDDDQAG